MRFVVVSEIEGDRRGDRVFDLLGDAQGCYNDLESICMDGPDDSLGGDPSIVTNCWLYSVDAADDESAKRVVIQGGGVLIAVCFPPDPS